MYAVGWQAIRLMINMYCHSSPCGEIRDGRFWGRVRTLSRAERPLGFRVLAHLRQADIRRGPSLSNQSSRNSEFEEEP